MTVVQQWQSAIQSNQRLQAAVGRKYKSDEVPLLYKTEIHIIQKVNFSCVKAYLKCLDNAFFP